MRITSQNLITLKLVLAACSAFILSACGGGSPDATSISSIASPTASGATILHMGVDTVPADAATLVAQPLFHSAPSLLPEPDGIDTNQNDASAGRAPHETNLALDVLDVPTSRLTADDIRSPARMRSAIMRSKSGTVTPKATPSVVATYTPAQIRSAYGLPVLPSIGTTPTPDQAAQMGAGQTIYIVDAMNDPSAAAELAAFNTKFGLPGCTTKSIPTTTSLPLAGPSVNSCDFSVVFNTSAGTLSGTTPAYDSGWATEIALDVQWAHATAPLARIILIEAADASTASLVGAINLANAMGPGVVSMSFGANEGSWTSSLESAFLGKGMTYLGATGDNGAAVSWPSVSPNVVAVGGTTLTYSGAGARSEVSWSGTGGGISAFTPAPSYQTNTVPGMGNVAHRAVADVAFNADPASGQYVAVMSPGVTTASWLSAGGTSLSTPQWAGLIAIANAQRVASAKPVLGSPHSILYGQISTVPGTYASAFSDITKGSDGTCALCTAKVGYDPLTGLGTPNVAGLLTSLSGTTVATAPVVTPATINITVGTALSFTASVTAPNPVTYTLTGAPSGMAVSTTGIVTWATPVIGTYQVTVTANDTKTALSGSGIYTLVVAQQAAPVVTASSISGTAGVALSFTASATSKNPVTFSMTGAPSGMAISTTGIVTWASPAAGTYNVTVVAKDTKTSLTGQGVYTVAISAPLPPAVTASTITGKPGTALTFTAAATAPNPVTFTIAGAPSGMTATTAGVISWPSPVIGTYSVTVIAKDSKTGLSGQGVYTVKIATAGPVITSAPMTGTAGKALTGSFSFSDPTATSMSISISGVPLGMYLTMSGMTITATWPSPVKGTYSMNVVCTDNFGLTAKVTIPITIL